MSSMSELNPPWPISELDEHPPPQSPSLLSRMFEGDCDLHSLPRDEAVAAMEAFKPTFQFAVSLAFEAKGEPAPVTDWAPVDAVMAKLFQPSPAPAGAAVAPISTPKGSVSTYVTPSDTLGLVGVLCFYSFPC